MFSMAVVRVLPLGDDSCTDFQIESLLIHTVVRGGLRVLRRP